MARDRKRTIIPDPALPCPYDKVNWNPKTDIPDRLRVAAFTNMRTKAGLACADFVIDTFARRIVKWHA